MIYLLFMDTCVQVCLQGTKMMDTKSTLRATSGCLYVGGIEAGNAEGT